MKLPDTIVENDARLDREQKTQLNSQNDTTSSGQIVSGLVNDHLYEETATLLARVADGYSPPHPPGPIGIPHHFAAPIQADFTHNITGLNVILFNAPTDITVYLAAFRVLSSNDNVLYQLVQEFKGKSAKLHVLTLDAGGFAAAVRHLKAGENKINITVYVSTRKLDLGISAVRARD